MYSAREPYSDWDIKVVVCSTVIRINPRQLTGLAHAMIPTAGDAVAQRETTTSTIRCTMQQVQAGTKIFGKCQPVVAAGTVAEWLSGRAACWPSNLFTAAWNGPYGAWPSQLVVVPLLLLQSKVLLFAMSHWPKPNSISSSAVGSNVGKPQTSSPVPAGARTGIGTGTGAVATRFGSDRIGSDRICCHMCSTGYKTVFGSIDFRICAIL